MLNRSLATKDEISVLVSASPMRIALCDYSGHPFQAQLSRELARRGHDVLHLHFAEFQTPKGRLEREANDPACFAVEPVSIGRNFSKQSLVRRRFDEIEVGRRFAARLDVFAPDIVIGCNLPLDALSEVIGSCRRLGRRFVFWQQDIYSLAIRNLLRKRLGWAGGLVARYYRRMERRALELSDAVVVISPDFPDVLAREFNLDLDHVHVVENWAPLDEITPLAKDNEWTRAQALGGRKLVLYTGTLGMKHNPALLLSLARALESRGDAVLVVTSEGPAADWLSREGARCRALRVLPFQPYAMYPKVLAGGDVLVSILEPDAGIFSVPSKVLSYMCAGRAIVLYAPQENLASRLLTRSGAGYAVSDASTFSDRVIALLDEPLAASSAGNAARRYAEENFQIRAIAEKFETVLGGVRYKNLHTRS